MNEKTETAYSMYTPIYSFNISFTKFHISLSREILKDAKWDELKKEAIVKGFHLK